MASSNSDVKTADKAQQPTTPTTTPATTNDPAAQTAAAAYYQQYGYQYGYYPQYNYAAYYQQLADPSSAAYAAYYKQYQQQMKQQPTQTEKQSNNDNKTDNNEQSNQNNENNDNKESKTNINDANPNPNPKKHDMDNNEDSDIENNSTNTSSVEGNNDNDNSNSKDLRLWTKEEVATWMNTVSDNSFAQYSSSFLENEINGKVLYNITLKQLQFGLYINNMMQRFQLYELIQKLKNNDNNTSTSGCGKQITSVTELPRAPPIKRRKRKKKNKRKHDGNSNSVNDNVITHQIGTAAFIQKAKDFNNNNSKTSSQLLFDKMNNKRERDNDYKDIGVKHEIEWKYSENKKYDALNINICDTVLFKWIYTKNIWQFGDRDAFKNNDFNKFGCVELCGVGYTDDNVFEWKPKKIGTYYFGCQVGNCAETGNMKIQIIVHNNNNNNPTKKRRLK